MDRRWLMRTGLALLVRPGLWVTAMRTVWRLRRDRWWARSPHLPVPPPDYLRFRMVTAYGEADARPPTHDVVTYLQWCRSWPAVRT